MKNTIDKIEAAFLDAGRLRKSIGIAEEARAIADSFRAIDSQLAAIEKRSSDELAARYGFGAADNERARIGALEAELAALKARHDGDISGMSATIGRGGPSGLGNAESPPAARAVDPWRH